MGQVLHGSATTTEAGTAEAIADGLALSAWTRLSAGEGTKGAQLYDWASCELADLDGADYDQTSL